MIGLHRQVQSEVIATLVSTAPFKCHLQCCLSLSPTHPTHPPPCPSHFRHEDDLVHLNVHLKVLLKVLLKSSSTLHWCSPCPPSPFQVLYHQRTWESFPLPPWRRRQQHLTVFKVVSFHSYSPLLSFYLLNIHSIYQNVGGTSNVPLSPPLPHPPTSSGLFLHPPRRYLWKTEAS